MFSEFLQRYNIDDKKLAVGVSGGADSLALVLMMNEELSPLGIRLVALTVDHGLRGESAEEASYVAAVMAENGIEHHILRWEGPKPVNGVEEAARQARYGLLGQYCAENGIGTLAVAHHLQDQAETFLMRLQRGSGLDGLCGMAPVSHRGDLRIIRPLLKTAPELLKSYLRQKQVVWVEDPSNQSDGYLRVRVRKFMPLLSERLGIDAARIVSTMQTLSFSRDCLNRQAAKFVENHVRKWNGAGFCFSRRAFEQLPTEIAFRVLGSLIKETGGREYAPEGREIMRLQGLLSGEKFKGCTLGDCEIFLFREKIWGVPELKSKRVLTKKEWDVFCEFNAAYKKIRLPYKLRLSLYKLNPIYR